MKLHEVRTMMKICKCMWVSRKRGEMCGEMEQGLHAAYVRDYMC